MDFEKQREIEYAKNAEMRVKLAAALALLAGEGLTVEAPEPDAKKWDCRAIATHAASGAKVWATFSAGYGDRRVHVSGQYPRTKKGEYVTIYAGKGAPELKANTALEIGEYGKVLQPSITISAEKTADKIARDIKNRFLAAFIEYAGLNNDRIASDNNYHDTSEATLEAVTGAPLRDYDRNRKEAGIPDIGKLAGQEYEVRIRAKASRECVTLEIDNIGADIARRIVEMIKAEAVPVKDE